MPGDEATTAEFLTRLAVERDLGWDKSYFAPRGVRPAEGPVSTADPLRSENNAWRIVTGLDFHSSPPNLPLLITRNLVQPTLADPPQLSRQRPFGRRGAVVIRLNGTAQFISADNLESEWRRLVGPDPPPNPILPP